ncbi:mitochondrial inner membrane protease ATP23 homolog isoform X2 [Bufo gargarizans]|uniref:mitochondrial inner membrane protease ATP23 homolog isoform X2 n=1 Tax=Bufo gargarizans TaxID=30331 RepID=UPI001CF5F629|nr:mitochondrial inner membrane protease ATP23 homolog isoform X2 [Bufo gargarizans]
MEEDGSAHGQHGYPLFPDRQSWETTRDPMESKSCGANHKCQRMLRLTMETSPYAKLLLDAMKLSGCTVSRDRHFSCEDCDGSVSGGFDADTSEIVLCQNNIHNQSHMNRVVTHELIHAFDHCRAHVDWFNNVRHLACSEACVRDRSLRSILAVRQISREAAEKAVDDVFQSCFNDYEPFGRIPHCKRDADMAYRDFKKQGRYYANL